MSVSEDLLCSFELLKPLDGAALKKEMTKSKRKSYVYKFIVCLFGVVLVGSASLRSFVMEA
jgi:hypothetical protein